MNDSTFDPATLLSSEVSDSFDTRLEPPPEDEYIGMILPADEWPPIRQVNTKRGEQHILSIPIRLDAPGVELAHNRVVRKDCWLDITPQGALDFGKQKNLDLGRMRAATGQNAPGKAWRMSDLGGQAIRLRVGHRTADDGNVYGDVTKVAPV